MIVFFTNFAERGWLPMKVSLINFKLTGYKMFIPERDKGEMNPYTSGEERYNPFMKKETILIDQNDIPDVLALLEKKGYDVAKFCLR